MSEINLTNIKNILTKCRKHLEFLVKNIERRSKGIEIIYALDISILYSWMYPYSKKLHSQKIVEYILKNKDNIKFTILPGTLYKILSHIQEEIKEHENLMNCNEYQKFISHSEIKNFFNIFKKLDSVNSVVSLYLKMSKIKPFIFLTKEANRHLIYTPLNRLKELIEKKILIPIEDIVELEKINIDEGIFNTIVLNQDLIKAYDFIINYALNESYYSEGKYFNILWTSPPVDYKKKEWKNDPIKKLYPEIEFPIVIEPIDCFNSIKIAQKYPEFKSQIEYVKKGIALCKRLSETIKDNRKFEYMKKDIEDFMKEYEELTFPILREELISPEDSELEALEVQEENTKWIIENYHTLKCNYPNEWVGVYQRKVIDHAKILKNLMKKLNNKYQDGTKYMAIEYIPTELVRVIL